MQMVITGLGFYNGLPQDELLAFGCFGAVDEFITSVEWSHFSFRPLCVSVIFVTFRERWAV